MIREATPIALGDVVERWSAGRARRLQLVEASYCVWADLAEPGATELHPDWRTVDDLPFGYRYLGNCPGTDLFRQLSEYPSRP